MALGCLPPFTRAPTLCAKLYTVPASPGPWGAWSSVRPGPLGTCSLSRADKPGTWFSVPQAKRSGQSTCPLPYSQLFVPSRTARFFGFLSPTVHPPFFGFPTCFRLPRMRLFPSRGNPRRGSSGFDLSPAASASPLAAMALSLALHLLVVACAPAIEGAALLLLGDSRNVRLYAAQIVPLRLPAKLYFYAETSPRPPAPAKDRQSKAPQSSRAPGRRDRALRVSNYPACRPSPG